MSMSAPPQTQRGRRDDSPGQAPTNGREPVLKEIQALRAVAVALVVTYHVWPERLRGGFLGVSMFFVLSGFLITSLLLSESAARGRIGLRDFWRRRFRRSSRRPSSASPWRGGGRGRAIPTSCAPPCRRIGRRGGLRGELALHLPGRRLRRALPAAERRAALLVAGDRGAVLHRRGPAGSRCCCSGGSRRGEGLSVRARLIVVAVLAVTATAVSFVHAVNMTSFAPSLAYFSTFARAWEFGAGVSLASIVALSPALFDRLRSNAVWGQSRVVTLLGLGLIAISALTIDGSRFVPRADRAGPVLGTVPGDRRRLQRPPIRRDDHGCTAGAVRGRHLLLHLSVALADRRLVRLRLRTQAVVPLRTAHSGDLTGSGVGDEGPRGGPGSSRAHVPFPEVAGLLVRRRR